MWETIIGGLAVAAISWLLYAAYQHPDGYEELYAQIIKYGFWAAIVIYVVFGTSVQLRLTALDDLASRTPELNSIVDDVSRITTDARRMGFSMVGLIVLNLVLSTLPKITAIVKKSPAKTEPAPEQTPTDPPA